MQSCSISIIYHWWFLWLLATVSGIAQHQLSPSLPPASYVLASGRFLKATITFLAV